MIPSNPIPEVPNYGSSAIYRDLPSPEQIRAGVIPLDSLPAAWWNALWNCTNGAVNEARSAVGTLINEVCNAITGAGICINESCIDQLYQAIDTIRQRVGNAVTAGAVKSSTCCGEVSIDANGIMTANGVGNAAQLNTTSKVVVGAINELKTTYDCCFSDLSGCISGVDNSKAPTSHVSSNTTYGVGNADCYGHLKISDEYTCCVGSAADGVAASQLAVYCVYEAISAAASLGNTAGCPLGTAAAGTATTAARSDHVHPVPTCISQAGSIWNCSDPNYCICVTPSFTNSEIKLDGMYCQAGVGYGTCVTVDCAARAGFAHCANALRIQPHSSCNALICVMCQQWIQICSCLLVCACTKTNLLMINKNAASGCTNCLTYAKSGYMFATSCCVCNKNSFNEAEFRKCFYKCYYFIQLSCVID